MTRTIPGPRPSGGLWPSKFDPVEFVSCVSKRKSPKRTTPRKPPTPPCASRRHRRSPNSPGAGTPRLGLEHGTRDTPAAGYDARAAATGTQPQNHGSFTLPPRRRARVEDRPRLSPTGRRRDSVRAHPAQGCAVCAPPEADADARNPRKPASLSGQDGFGDFPRKESHPGVAAPAHPCARGICASCTSQGAEHPALSGAIPAVPLPAPTIRRRSRAGAR